MEQGKTGGGQRGGRSGGKASEGVGNDLVGGAFSQLLLPYPCCSRVRMYLRVYVYACVRKSVMVCLSLCIRVGVSCAGVCVERQAPPAVPGAPLPCPAPRIICPSDPS